MVAWHRSRLLNPESKPVKTHYEMKTKIIATIFSLLALPSVALCQEVTDTIVNVPAESKIVITENPNGTLFTVTPVDAVYGEEESLLVKYPENASVSSRQTSFRSIFGHGIEIGGCCRDNGYWSIIADGICIGLNRANGQGSPDAMQWSKSFELSWLSCIGVSYSYKAFAVSLGFGFDWRNYRCTTSDLRLVVNEERGITWQPYADGERGRMSRLKTFALQFPLLCQVRIPGTSLTVKGGSIMCVNTYASVKSVYDDPDGNKCEEFAKGIGIRKVTLDLLGNVSLNGGIGLYVRYSPMKVMKSPGINFRPLTVGVSIGF